MKTGRQQTQAAGEGPRLRVGDGDWGSLARDTLTHLGPHLHTGSSISPPQTDPPTPALDVEPTWPFHPCMRRKSPYSDRLNASRGIGWLKPCCDGSFHKAKNHSGFQWGISEFL